MKTRILVALAIGVLLGVWGAAKAQDHAGPPGRSPEEQCTWQCHVQHCDDYVKCIGTADVNLCRRGVNEKEMDCMKKCEPPRG